MASTEARSDKAATRVALVLTNILTILTGRCVERVTGQLEQLPDYTRIGVKLNERTENTGKRMNQISTTDKCE